MSEIKTASALSDQTKDFFKQFKDEKGDYKYIIQIDRLKEYSSILINTRDFLKTKLESGLELYNELNLNPEDFLKGTERAIREIFQETRGGQIKFSVHVDEVERNPPIIEVLGNEHLNHIVTIKGMIVSSSEIFLIPKEITYSCSNNHIFQIFIEGVPEIPKIFRCGLDPKCTSRNFTEILGRTIHTKHRTLLIKSDENFSFTDDELELDVTGDLTEIAQAGDRVKVTGIVRPIKKNHYIKSSLTVLFIQKTDDIDLTISPEDELVFAQFPNQPDFYSRMINSIAPSVLGLKNIKESLLLQRVASPDVLKKDGTVVRGFFNIGLFGDPGTAKTKLAEWEQANLTKTIFVMSKGATSTGLLLGLEEGSDGRKRLRAGAMVLCRDDGLVAIDEFPRLSSEVIDGLYTTMENGIASISKTGHVKTLRANTPVLATGNAHNGDWNTALNLQDNLGITSTFLQRFDYTWVLIDHFDKRKDQALADITLEDTTYEDDERPHSATTLSKYIKYVRRF
ncbi:MAG: AAA family ATPase, partial [Nitrososphaeraceae archaeon]